MSLTIDNNTLVQILVRRGTDASRKTVVLTQGEIGFTTDTQRIFIGDGITSGGVSVAAKFLSNTTSINSLTSIAQVGDITFDPNLNNIYLFTSTGFQAAGPTYIAGSGFVINSNTINLNTTYWTTTGSSITFGKLSATNAIISNYNVNINGSLSINGTGTQQLVLSSGSNTTSLSTNGQLIINTGLLHQFNPTTSSSYDLVINGSTFINGALSASSSNIAFNNTGVTSASALSSYTPTYNPYPNLTIQSGGRAGNLTQPYTLMQYSPSPGVWNTGLYITAQPFFGVNVSDTYLQSIGTDTSNINFAVSGNSLFTNTIRVSGDVIANFTPSDIRLKKNITPITNALDKIIKLQGVNFNWRDNYIFKGNDVGLLAQDVENIIPEAVMNRTDGWKGVDYTKIIPLIVEAIKELQSKI